MAAVKGVRLTIAISIKEKNRDKQLAPVSLEYNLLINIDPTNYENC